MEIKIGDIWADGCRTYYFINKIETVKRWIDGNNKAVDETGIYFMRLGDLSYSKHYNMPVERDGFCFLSTFRSFSLKKVN